MLIKIKDILVKILGVACVALFILIIFLGLYQVITRYVFNSPSSWSEEMLTYGFAWMAMLGMALVTARREHMRLTFVIDKFKLPARVSSELIVEIITLLFALIVFVFGGFHIVALTMPQITPALQWRTGAMYLCIPISGIFMVIFCLINILTIKGIVKEDIRKKEEDEKLEKEAAAAEEAAAKKAPVIGSEALDIEDPSAVKKAAPKKPKAKSGKKK